MTHSSGWSWATNASSDSVARPDQEPIRRRPGFGARTPPLSTVTLRRWQPLQETEERHEQLVQRGEPEIDLRLHTHDTGHRQIERPRPPPSSSRAVLPTPASPPHHQRAAQPAPHRVQQPVDLRTLSERDPPARLGGASSKRGSNDRGARVSPCPVDPGSRRVDDGSGNDREAVDDVHDTGSVPRGTFRLPLASPSTTWPYHPSRPSTGRVRNLHQRVVDNGVPLVDRFLSRGISRVPSIVRMIPGHWHHALHVSFSAVRLYVNA